MESLGPVTDDQIERQARVAVSGLRTAAPSGAGPDTAAPFGPSGDCDLRAIRCLLVLAEERHYARAAARLHMSQPGLSRAIRRLERRVGVRLVTRVSRPLELTTQGEILVYYGHRLLGTQQAALNAILESLRAPSDTPGRQRWPSETARR
jgi:hypothetical protein